MATGPKKAAWPRTIDSLPAGKSVRLDVHFTCQTAAAKACQRVSAIATDGSHAEADACPGNPRAQPSLRNNVAHGGKAG